jgi:putative transposase
VHGSANFEEVLGFASVKRKSFRELKELEGRSELPAWLEPKPPKHLKKPIIVVRFDNYRVLECEGAIWLKYYNVKLRFKGELRWWRQRVQQGRLVIVYDEVKRAWYAHIASKVKLKREKRKPLKCGINLGQVHLVDAAAR